MKKVQFSLVRAVLIALLAAYTPALLWRPWENLGQGEAGVLLSVFSPVALPVLLGMLVLPAGNVAGCVTLAVTLLALFLLALLVLSMFVHRSLASTLFLAYVLFGVSLAQGILFSLVIHGLEAMAHL
jgi:hypothetical protein